ncbi:MAG: PstS family phosphate ABC transporter substrate-binding protein [Verrucomicrobia bacterium]|nr:PstS family phosphate ABC transporter substrate-binding protein [Verrucomicrobiota bacterium]
MKKTGKTMAVMACVGLVAGLGQAREQIRIVGSSTVYPFSSAVAEEFGATTEFPTPVVESTGSGGGHKLFSQGVGDNTPDITNSSRKMKKSEFEANVKNGVGSITEVVIGYDGIAIAHNVDNDELTLSIDDLFRAVAALVPVDGELVANPYEKWSDINPALPDTAILIYGPPTTSGTRDAFHELVMHKAAKKYKELYEPIAKKGEYQAIRDDGAYVDAGENDNLIVQKLEKESHAIGIFGYSFLEENGDRIQGAVIEGVSPEPATISSGEYPISRSLYFYVKNAHLGVIPGLKEYVDLFVSEQMIGDRGYLKRVGLVPLPADQRAEVRKNVAEAKALTAADFE